VAETKREVQEKTSGEEFVSEGDVVANWVQQASFPLSLSSSFRISDCRASQVIYHYDPSPPSYFTVSATSSLRNLCSTSDVSLEEYPHS
jgi:hypothetical protein